MTSKLLFAVLLLAGDEEDGDGLIHHAFVPVKVAVLEFDLKDGFLETLHKLPYLGAPIRLFLLNLFHKLPLSSVGSEDCLKGRRHWS